MSIMYEKIRGLLTFKRIALFLMLLLLLQPLMAESIIYDWDTRIEGALSEAQKDDKYLFVYFAGSDWCPHCARFDQEILSSPRFQRFLARNFVPVLIDFPRSLPIGKEQLDYNQQQLSQFGVQGFPTVLLLDSRGSVLYRANYGGGGVRHFINQLSEYLPSS